MSKKKPSEMSKHSEPLKTMEYTIIGVKRRGFIARLGSIAEYQVTVKLEDASIIRVNAWAGLGADDSQWLIENVSWKLDVLLHSKRFLNRKRRDNMIKAVIGKEGKIYE